MKRQTVIDTLNASDHWTMDRFGHFKNANGTMRVKIQSTSLRVEGKSKYDGRWINRVSDYYKNVETFKADDGRNSLNIKGRLLHLSF